MKSVTVAVILAGLVSYGTIYTSAAEPNHGPSYSALAIGSPQLPSDPDDEEGSRIQSRKKNKPRTL